MKYHLIHRFISLTAVIPVTFIIRQAFASKQEVSVVELTTSNLKWLRGYFPPYHTFEEPTYINLRKEGIETSPTGFKPTS